MASYLVGAPATAGSGPGNPFVLPNHFSTSYGSHYNKAAQSTRYSAYAPTSVHPYAPVATDLPYAAPPGVGMVEDGFVTEAGEVGVRSSHSFALHQCNASPSFIHPSCMCVCSY
jgi:hypothetical protein